ncbi:MAG TPA: iron-containing alcohol dehydrogenase, partial [bacterium]|nr:iron-containing alcohol dehydrogenase [bacterium]
RTAREGILRMEKFFAEIGMPTRLSEVGIDPKRFPELAEKCEKRGSIKKLTSQDIRQILESALS